MFYSAIAARPAGFDTTVVPEASRGIDLEGSMAHALPAMREAGVTLLS